MKQVYKNARVGARLTDIVCENGVILSVDPCDLPGEDLAGALVFPGLVDIHTHGCAGEDVMDGDLSLIARFLRAHGTTAFLPTTMSAPFEEIARATAHCPTVEGGATILGFHTEGPYLSPKYKGAMSETVLKIPDLAEFQELSHVRLVTLAPELPGALEFIRHCGCHAFLGHTACQYEEAMAAFEAGAVGLTHVFNAMAPLNHRHPGPIGAAIDTGAYVQVIGDGFHLHPATVRMLYRLFGPERLILISDSMAATGMPVGEYKLGNQHTIVKNGEARLADGTIAGSTVTLLQCVQRVIAMGIPAEDAFRMASETPARMLGEKRGVIAPGYAADLLVTDDHYQLLRVI